MRTIVTMAAAGLAAALGAGCATAPGTAEVVGARYHLAELDTYDLVVTSIDGRDTPIGTRLFLDPGRREIGVRGPVAGNGRIDVARFSLEAKPCTRYYLVAVKANRLATDFQVRVDHEEPLAICAPSAG